MIKLTLPDGSIREVEAGTTLLDVVKGMSNSLAKKALAASLDGKTVDLTMRVAAMHCATRPHISWLRQ